MELHANNVMDGTIPPKTDIKSKETSRRTSKRMVSSIRKIIGLVEDERNFTVSIISRFA
jgi:hypothetical protein